jgi:hypothetical protein
MDASNAGATVSMPVGLRVAGGAMVLYAVITLLGFFFERGGSDTGPSGAEIVANLAVVLVLLTGGIGFLIQARWAWPIGLLTSVGAIAVGLLSLIPDIAFPGASVIALLLLVTPGALLLAGLMSPAARAWRKKLPADPTDATRPFPPRPD